MKKLLVIALLVIPQLASARVYMCVDQVTGETSFTDQACSTAGAREEVRLENSTPESNRNRATRVRQKTWTSDADLRKSGLEYNAERRSLYESKSAISAR